MDEKFQREVIFSPAFDKRDPNPTKDYGIGAAQVIFVLKGKKGAISIRIGTDAYLPETIEEYKSGKAIGRCGPIGVCDLREEKPSIEGERGPFRGWAIDSHRIKPASYQKKEDRDECKFTKTGFCYCDGSSLIASEKKLGEVLLRQGSDGIWKVAEEYYKSWVLRED